MAEGQSLRVGDRAVVIVGGGVAGGALATVLAREGRDVVVLERTTRYRDRVLGEYLVPWGVAEARRLGLLATMIGAGGNVITRLVHYDEGWSPQRARAEALALDRLVADAPGSLGIGHPALCEALAVAAQAAGADIRRGVREIRVTPGDPPTVRFTWRGESHELRPSLVVGADGRDSSVRRDLALERLATPVLGYGAGLLVSGAKAWPEQDEVIGNEGDRLFFVFPQGSGLVRLYRLVLPHERPRFRGAGRVARFLEEFRLASVPQAEALWGAEPAGPCATWPMHDAWVREPAAPGVVLVGDAAGYTNPLIGQGLSVALRDVRAVADVVLTGGGGAQPFAAYCAARRELLRRLRFTTEMFARQRCVMGPGAAERRVAVQQRMRDEPELGAWYLGALAGPERMPREAYAPHVRERLWGP